MVLLGAANPARSRATAARRARSADSSAAAAPDDCLRWAGGLGGAVAGAAMLAFTGALTTAAEAGLLPCLSNSSALRISYSLSSCETRLRGQQKASSEEVAEAVAVACAATCRSGRVRHNSPGEGGDAPCRSKGCAPVLKSSSHKDVASQWLCRSHRGA